MTTQTAIPHYLRPNQMQIEMNEKLAKLVPELQDSPLTRAPLVRNKWCKPSETLEDSGEPCFIAASMRHKVDVPDYIWMPQRKDLPAGYYHLRTQEAYIQIYHLVRKQKVPLHKRVFGRLNKRSRKKMELHQKVEDLMYLRLSSEKPDDIQAARARLLNTQREGTALAFGKASYLPTLLLGFAL